MQYLAVEVRFLDGVPVHQPYRSHASADQVRSSRAAQPADADNKYRGILQAELP